MEDQENQEQSVGKQVAEQGKQMAEQAAKDVAKQTAKQAGKAAAGALKKAILPALAAAAPYIIAVLIGIILLVVIVGGIVAIRDKILEIGKNVASSIASFIEIGDNGPLAPNAKEMVELINKQLEENGIDKEGLGLGSDAHILGMDSQVDNYLYKFMSASLSTQLPYIKESTAETLTDIASKNPLLINPATAANEIYKLNQKKDVQGIVKIKRKTGNKTKDLTFIKHDKFEELINNNDTKALEYFSIDEEWMLCIAKTTKTTTYNTDGTHTEDKQLEEVTIPYQTMISSYSVPFEFFISLQQATQNAEYVSAVADLIQGGEIELTIFDSTQVVTTESKYEYEKRNKKRTIVSTSTNTTTEETSGTTSGVTSGATAGTTSGATAGVISGITAGITAGITSGATTGTTSGVTSGATAGTNTGDNNTQTEEKKEEVKWEYSDPEFITETTTTVQEINSIMAAITKADVWVIKQEAEYIKNETTEYPLKEEGITTKPEPESEKEPEGEGSWKLNQSYTTKQTVEKEEWQLENSNIEINESKFLGLWKNNYFGVYIKGAAYAPNGTLVKYALPDSLFRTESPLENLSSNEEWLYSDLEKSENTQTHAQLMRYLIQYYKTGEKADMSELLSLFSSSAYTEGSFSGRIRCT